MKLIRPFTIVVALILVLTILACKTNELVSSDMRMVTIATPQDIQTLDPRKNNDTYTSRILWQIYESLIGLDANGSLVPQIAESWTTQDNKVWNLTIRKNVQFHPSQAFKGPAPTVSAEDVRYSLEQHCSPGSFSAYVFVGVVKGAAEYNQAKVSGVEGFVTLDPQHVVITLVHPEPEFPYRLANPSVVVLSKQAIEFYGERIAKDVAVGTGPFILRERRLQEILLERHSSYWRPTASNAVRQLRFVIVKNPQITLLELIEGHIDIADIPSEISSTIIQNGRPTPKYSRFKILEQSLYNVHFLGFNLARIRDSHLRRAVALAVDRQTIIRAVFRGQASPASGLVPAQMRGCPGSEGLPVDESKARQEANLAKQKEFELVVHDVAGATRLGELIQSQLAPFGIVVRLTRVDFGTAIQTIIAGNADAFIMFFDYVYGSPGLLFDCMKSDRIPVPNFWRYKNASLDALLNNFSAPLSANELCSTTALAETMIASDVPAVFLARTRQSFLFAPDLSGIALTPVNRLDLSDLSIMIKK